MVVARKPTKEEYMLLVRITLLGVLLLGLMGFVIAILFSYLGIARAA